MNFCNGALRPRPVATTARETALSAARPRKAVLAVAGLGKGLFPATKSIPKEMLPLVDRPIIQYAIEEARAAGIEEFIFATGPGKSAIEDYLEAAPAIERALRESGRADLIAALRPIEMAAGASVFIRQRNGCGLGEAILSARRLIGAEPFAVILPCDVVAAETPCLAQLAIAHGRVGGVCMAVETAPRAACGDRLLVEAGEDDGRLVSVGSVADGDRPEAASSGLAAIGRFILPPSVFDGLERLKRDVGAPVRLADAIREEIRAGRPVHGLRFAGRRFDCGSTVGLLQATVAFALERGEMAGALSEFFAAGAARGIAGDLSPARRSDDARDGERPGLTTRAAGVP